jgi:formyl-CoA transferase
VKFSDFTPNITGAPLLGEHTNEVLTDLGYSADQIAEMAAGQIILTQ